ncbi:MAG: ABC transporter permease [Lachnospiraceae bacterium]|jgi:hypothetical protein|nr:ABC transporter permease [Lachnospiraceae bacterium]
MMMKLLLVKEKCKEFYTKYDIYINPVLKFALALTALWMLNDMLGYMPRLGSLPVMLVVALLCSLLPAGAVVLFSAIFMLGHIYGLSLEAFVVCFALFGIMLFTYYIFKPGDGLVLVLVPLLFWLKLPYLAPLVVGLCGTALSAAPAGFGVLIYYMILAVKQNATVLTESETGSMLTRFQMMVDQIITNRAMMVMILAFAVTVVLVYVIRRLSVPYCFKIAIGVGAVAELAVILAGRTMLEVSRTNFTIPEIVIGVAVSALLSLVLEFFLFSVDYSRTEYVQFEDEDYYYYVKAVPKLTVTPPQREVKRFAVNQKGRERGLSETVDLAGDVKDLMEKDRIY